MHTDRCGNTSRQKRHTKGSISENKIQAIMYRETTTVEHEVYVYTGNNWSHRNSIYKKKGLRKYLEAIPGKHSVDPQQKIALLGTSHTIRNSPQSEA